MSNKFFTNRDGNTLFKKLEGVFSDKSNRFHHFDVLVGYFRSSGYFKVRPFLENIPKIRILVGIDVDRLTKAYHEKALLFLGGEPDARESFIEDTIKNIQEANYDKVTEQGIIQFIQDILEEKLEIKAHPSQKIHAKIYIFRPENFSEHSSGFVITGSSNFTDPGLGIKENSNYEFNVILKDHDDVKFATDEFEYLWNESVSILHAEANKIKNSTYIRDNFTPFEIYIKTLIEYFGKRIDYDPYNIELLLPSKYFRLKYQSDAANHGYAIMMKHNGFILADVVGLGKTIIANMILKKFIYENGTHTKVLVVIPPALETSWENTVKEFDIQKHFHFITIGSLHKVLDRNNLDYPNPEDIDLVVVDESHKFRNDYTEMYVNLQEICKKPRAIPSEVGDTKKKVILISATPLNNRPKDIESQIYLFQDKRSSSLENVRNLQKYFEGINDNYKKLVEETPLNINALKNLFERLRNDIIEPIVIRRTRKDIENNPEYLEDLKKQNIKFPNINDPIPLFYKLDETTARVFLETVTLISNLDEKGTVPIGYYRYRAIEFLEKEEHRKIYGNVSSISVRLSTIMRTLLVKRLESSFFAFKQSLKRFQKAIDNMITMFQDDRVFIAPDLNINKLLEEGYTYEEIEEKILFIGGNNREFSRSDFSPEFYNCLVSDKAKVDKLVVKWDEIITDPKLEEFLKKLRHTFFKKEINSSGKLVIFTESKETAEELSNKVKAVSKYSVLTVSAENRSSLEKAIKENFDANLEEEKWKEDYQIIITTEVLAEGINLHRSNSIINYDVPWNSTRLMQRIGRVNRIGTKAEEIFVYNFYPSSHGDELIRLVDHALRKLQAFHTAFGEDNKIFSLMEETGEAGLFGNKIKQEESEILHYLNFLRKFKKENLSHFQEIKNIPKKARCGRLNGSKKINLYKEEEEIAMSIKNCSLAFLKADNHPGIFCLVTEDMIEIELGFLKAMKILKAEETETSVALPESHFDQVNKAFEFFQTEKAIDNDQNITRRDLSVIENKSISNLRVIQKISNSEELSRSLILARESILNGVYTARGFPTDINNFFKKNQGLLESENGRMEFLNTFTKEVLLPSNSIYLEKKETEKSIGIVNPKIVITQSFV